MKLHISLSVRLTALLLTLTMICALYVPVNAVEAADGGPLTIVLDDAGTDVAVHTDLQTAFLNKLRAVIDCFFN